MIRFTNPIDVEKFDPDKLEVSPKIPGMKAVVSGDWLSIHGRTKGRTKYTVVVPASIEDTFEQTLGKPETLHFQVGDAYPQLFGPTGLTLRDPAGKKPTYDLHSINIASLDVEVYKVDVSDWVGFLKFMEKQEGGGQGRQGGRLARRDGRDRDRPLGRAQRKQARPRGGGGQADPLAGQVQARAECVGPVDRHRARRLLRFV
jgi:hypothetical protein